MEPVHPQLYGMDVYWIGTALAAVCALMVLVAIYSAVTLRDPMKGLSLIHI